VPAQRGIGGSSQSYRTEGPMGMSLLICPEVSRPFASAFTCLRGGDLFFDSRAHFRVGSEIAVLVQKVRNMRHKRVVGTHYSGPHFPKSGKCHPISHVVLRSKREAIAPGLRRIRKRSFFCKTAHRGISGSTSHTCACSKLPGSPVVGH